jgi:hypothetical protein
LGLTKPQKFSRYRAESHHKSLSGYDSGTVCFCSLFM